MNLLAENWIKKPRNISIINDTDGWSRKWCKKLKKDIILLGDNCELFYKYDDIPKKGDIAFFLGCTRIASPKILSKHLLNIIVHASDLPKGRGFSPLKWQIIENKNKICISLIQAHKLADAGKIYYKNYIQFEGHELLDEMQNLLGKVCNKMCLEFLSENILPVGKEQVGNPTFYKKRNITKIALTYFER